MTRSSGSSCCSGHPVRFDRSPYVDGADTREYREKDRSAGVEMVSQDRNRHTLLFPSPCHTRGPCVKKTPEEGVQERKRSERGKEKTGREAN